MSDSTSVATGIHNRLSKRSLRQQHKSVCAMAGKRDPNILPHRPQYDYQSTHNRKVFYVCVCRKNGIYTYFSKGAEGRTFVGCTVPPLASSPSYLHKPEVSPLMALLLAGR